MPRGIPKSGSSSTLLISSNEQSNSAIHAPPPTRHPSARSAKLRANASILEHDKEIDALIRKHEKKGARGFAKERSKKQPMTISTSSLAMEEIAKENEIGVENEEMDVENAQKGTKKRTTTKSTTKTSKTTKSKSTPSDDIEIAKSMTPKSSTKKSTKKSTKNSKQVDEDALDEQPKQTSSPQKSILSESSRKNNGAQESSKTPPQRKEQLISSSSAIASSSSPSKLKVQSNNRILQMSPVRSKFLSPSKKRKGMPEFQIESFLENYDLEAENRLRMAVKTLQISIDSARTQMHAKAIAKLPRAVRLMRLGDFVQEYGADVQSAVERAAKVADKARKSAWEEEKLQRKRKGGEDEEDAKTDRVEGTLRSKSAKLDEEKKIKTPSRIVSQSKRSKAKKVVRKGNLPSPIKETESQSARTSPMRPPSSATFRPNLATDVVIPGRSKAIPALPPTPANGKPRAARAGESVQWLSMNGSPIIGVVGPDGMIHAMPRTLRKSPSSVKKEKQVSRNWQSLEDSSDKDDDEEDQLDAAETSAHLLELAKGIDGFKRSRDSSGPFSKPIKFQPSTASTSLNASPISRASLHTAQASRRATLESEEGESIFEEARSYPDEDREMASDDELDCSLPDEEAYTAQIMREEAQKRARMLASEPRIARSSNSSRAYGVGRSSGSSGGIGSLKTNRSTARGSHATIRANTSHKERSSSSSFMGMPSSPMVKKQTSNANAKRLLSGSSSSSSSSPSKGRVSIVFGSGSRHRITQLGVEDLMRLSSQERNQMLEILEKLKLAQNDVDSK